MGHCGMPSPAPSAPRRRRRAVATLVALGAVAASGALVAPTAPSAAAPPATSERRTDALGPADVVMVQANIRSSLSTSAFQSDVRTVLGLQPDFISYNEVPLRTDPVMAPAGYDIYRDTSNRYTRATPVAWRSDRWTALETGTYRVSNHRGKPPGRKIELGRRFANWVTLTGTDGRVLSVVSAHVAPVTRGMPDLLRPSVARIGSLVDVLSERGPVLVGGDFNVHYRSGRYPADLLAAAQLVPTYDTLGSSFATGDHQGATIDYVFNRGDDALQATGHYPSELRSDHDAISTGFAWLDDAPAETTTVTNTPSGTEPERRLAMRAVVSKIRGARAHETVQVATSRLDLMTVTRELRRAVSRGVHVQLVRVGHAPTPQERSLGRHIRRVGDPGSWVRACLGRCKAAWRGVDSFRALVLVGGGNRGWRVRVDSLRRLSTPMVSKKTSVQVSRGELAITEGRRFFRSLG